MIVIKQKYHNLALWLYVFLHYIGRYYNIKKKKLINIPFYLKYFIFK